MLYPYMSHSKAVNYSLTIKPVVQYLRKKSKAFQKLSHKEYLSNNLSNICFSDNNAICTQQCVLFEDLFKVVLCVAAR